MEPLNECTLPKFLRRRQEHILMFGWVQALRKKMPSLSVQKAIGEYLDHFNIDGDTKALETEYQRMQKELMDADKG